MDFKSFQQIGTKSDRSSQGSNGSTIMALIKALRIPHWIKNLFVFAAILFARKWDQSNAWIMTMSTFISFCFLSSAIYLINDIADRNSDRAHPEKRNRPIASGQLSITVAAISAGILLLAGAGIIAYLSAGLYEPTRHLAGLGLAAWAGAYVVINLAYSLGLKNKPIIDVIIIAMGFVFRAMAGAEAISVMTSSWLVICTFTLCLFIALAKRRGEIISLGEQASQTRRVNYFYSPTNIEHMLAVSAGLAILTYMLYCLADQTVERIGSANLIWTIPIVVYGMFRYYCLTLATKKADPVEVLLHDKVLWLVGIVWLLCIIIILQWGSSGVVRGIIQ